MRFIYKSAFAYSNKEDFNEARRIATHLRVLFHHKGSNRALLKTLGAWDDLTLYDTSGGGVIIGPPTMIRGLIMLRESTNRTPVIRQTVPLFDRGPHGSRYFVRRPFAEWWSMPILTHTPSRTVFTRSDFVLSVAEQDGGAHVDPTISEKWALLSRDHAFDPIFGVENGKLVPYAGMDLAVICQIGYEAFTSLRERPDIAPDGDKPWRV